MSTRDRIASAFSLIVLLAALGGVVALADHGSWDPIILIALFALIVGADAMEVTFKGITMSGCFLGLIVAMALLGPAQAAALGFFSTLLWAVRTRPRPRMWAALLTIANLSATPLVGGLVMEQLGMQLDVGPTDFAFAGVVVAGFCITHVLNTAMTLTGIRFVDGVPITEGLRTVIVPLLPSDLAMVLLASGIVYAEAVLGPIALAMLVALFFLYLYLYRELIVSQQRGEELTKRTQQLASLQVGVLTAMLRTLSMRDQMTARHSAAVARYARAIAQAAGCSEEEQDLAHTAGLHTTSASSSCPTTSSWPTPSSARTTGSSSRCTRTRARRWSARSRATGRSRTSSGATTSASTAAGTRAAWPATTSR